MEKKDFDKKVQELIAGFEEEYDPKSWDSFEKKLQFEEEMDELIKSSMESYEEPFNEEHWEMLTQEIQRRKVRAIVKRTSEVVIILLLMMTAHNFLQFKGDKISDSREYIHITALEDSYPQINNFVNVTLSKNGSEDNSVLLAQKSNLDSGIEFESQNYKSSPLFLPTLTDGENTEKIIGENIISSIEESKITNKTLSLTSHQLDKLRIQPLIIDNNLIASVKDDPFTIIEEENGLWLTFVAGPDVNFINSPFDLNLLKSPIQSQSGTMTFGATMSKDIGLFEIATGVLYSKKNYSPFRIREFVPSINQRYLETSLRSLEFDQIQIPILVNLHTRRSSGWSMYGTFGIGANIITNTKYDIETQVRSFAAAPSNTKGVESLNLRELPRGAFQAGTFENNVYLSAIAGFGLEKRINNQYAFTLNTTYQRGLSNEINPVINRTQQLSMSFGVKVNLK